MFWCKFTKNKKPPVSNSYTTIGTYFWEFRSRSRTFCNTIFLDPETKLSIKIPRKPVESTWSCSNSWQFLRSISSYLNSVAKCKIMESTMNPWTCPPPLTCLPVWGYWKLDSVQQQIKFLVDAGDVRLKVCRFRTFLQPPEILHRCSSALLSARKLVAWPELQAHEAGYLYFCFIVDGSDLFKMHLEVLNKNGGFSRLRRYHFG